jgi:tetratricopeptide (TPR) repeat protein
LIEYHLRQHDFAEAIAVARAGQQKRSDSTEVANRLLEAQALAAQKSDPNNIQPLIDALSRDPVRRGPEIAALKTLRDIRAGKVPRAEVTAHLRAAADKYPRFLPLQKQVIERKVEEAVTLARRTMAALPTDAEAARLAVRTMRAARLWGEMKLAAEQWKSRLASGSLEADVAIAEALLETGSSEAAIAHLQPHRDLIDADVRTQPQAAVVIARAMLMDDNGRSARELLKPLLQDVSGRRIWQMIALGACRTLDESRTWLAAVESATPTDSVDEKYALSKCWITIARKYDDTKTLELAADRLAEYVAQRPRDGEALLLIGGAYLQLDRIAPAEAALRAILQNEPEHAAAANDLACLLVSQNRSLDEAEKLARVAAKKNPTNAAFQDTLARALLARGQFDAAKTVFESALKLDPDLVVARVGYARTLKTIGDTAAASRELKRVDTQLQVNPRAGRHLEEELSQLRAQLSPTE